MENLVKLTIDGVSVEVPAGTTVLEAAKKAGINIPTLCYLKDINQIGACRMCIVDTGARAFGAACVLPVANGMNVKTNTPKIREARRVNLELLLSNHDKKCLECPRNQKCELQQMCNDLGVDDVDKYKGKMNQYDIDDLSPSIVRDNNKCILCRRCVAACNKTQAVGVIGPMGRGFKTQIRSAWDQPLNDVACINCGQCIAACPTGALYEKDSTKAVWDLLSDTTKHVVVQPAPAVRAALGEEFGIPMGTAVTGKMAAALRRLGFEKVFDTDWAADLTIMEEGTEFIGRLKNGGGAAPNHQLLSRMDQVLRNLLSGLHPEPVQLQEPPRNGRRHDQELLGTEGRHRPQGYPRGLRDALHREEVRSQAA